MKIGDEVVMAWEVAARSEDYETMRHVPWKRGIIVAMGDFGERVTHKVACVVYEDGSFAIIDRERAVVTREGHGEPLAHVSTIPLDVIERCRSNKGPVRVHRVARPKTLCSECKEPQFNAADGSGVTCKNGHGGALGVVK